MQSGILVLPWHVYQCAPLYFEVHHCQPTSVFLAAVLMFLHRLTTTGSPLWMKEAGCCTLSTHWITPPLLSAITDVSRAIMGSYPTPVTSEVTEDEPRAEC